ncbi:MAG TPA: hypothetical protein VF042_16555 [Gemmatimonadaceae bacterium]
MLPLWPALAKVTIATSSGAMWLALVSHFTMGLIALGSGTIALVVAKGGDLHKKSGIAFTVAMIFLGLSAAAISRYEGVGFGAGGLFTVYLVWTAMTTVKKMPGTGRTMDIAFMLVAFALAAMMYSSGIKIWNLPGHSFEGVPAGMILFMGTVSLLAAIGDARMVIAGSIRGARRIARHLWRMCFALFIGTGSFFLGQSKFIPEPVRFLPMLFVLALAPLFILLYWMWRIRLRRRLSGVIIAAP